IAFIGLQGSGIVIPDEATLLTIGSLTSPGTLITIFGLIVTIIFLVRKIYGEIFYGMILTALLGVVTGVIPIPSSIVGAIPSLEPVFGVSISQMFTVPDQVFTMDLVFVVLTFLFVEFFDTAGTLMAVATKAGLIK